MLSCDGKSSTAFFFPDVLCRIFFPFVKPLHMADVWMLLSGLSRACCSLFSRFGLYLWLLRWGQQWKMPFPSLSIACRARAVLALPKPAARPPGMTLTSLLPLSASSPSLPSLSSPPQLLSHSRLAPVYHKTHPVGIVFFLAFDHLLHRWLCWYSVNKSPPLLLASAPGRSMIKYVIIITLAVPCCIYIVK